VSGEISLTTARLIGRHLTHENHQDVLVRACNRSRREIEDLVAELAPRPDVPTSVRKIPVSPLVVSTAPTSKPTAVEAVDASPAPLVLTPTARPVIQATAPERYRVQFTVGAETHDTLRRLQTLLRREIPSGDPAEIVGRALKLLLEKVEKTKFGIGARPRRGVIRPGTDNVEGSATFGRAAIAQRPGPLFDL
jgi:hypothetical protein